MQSMNDYIVLDGKRYKVSAGLYQPITSRIRSISTSLTGKTIVQDFTPATMPPKQYALRLRVFTADRTDAWGYLSYLRDVTYPKTSIPLTLFDGTQLNVIIAGDIKEVPRVAANISGSNEGVTYVDVLLLVVY